jgi:integrase
MPAKTLTAKFVKAIEATGQRVEYFDQTVPGLVLRVSPTGAKSWCVMYRHRRRLRRYTIGSTEAFTLADAREEARERLRDARKGGDPATEKQEARKAETIADLATLYLEKWAKPRKRSWKADKNLLDHKVLPKWRHRTIVEIRRRDVLALVQSVAESGAPIVANRVAALLSKMFAFAVDHELIDVSPAMRIPRPGREQQRDRVLTNDELQTLWREFEALDTPMAGFYKLRLITAQRGAEVAAMQWTEVDLDAGWWTIPATNSKNGLAHRVPLSTSAVTILRDVRADRDAHPIDKEEVGEQTRERAIYVLSGARGKRQQAEAAETFTVKDFRGHDLRRTAASFMAGGGVPRLTISKVLNDVERGVTAIYDRHSYDPEKRAALDWWSAKLTAIIAGSESKVLPFARVAGA